MTCSTSPPTFTVCNYSSRPQLATRLLAHKIQSPQEWEAMQALLVSSDGTVNNDNNFIYRTCFIQENVLLSFLFHHKVLETCMKNCGKRFHNEVGKFRFLNELIKVVSPKVRLSCCACVLLYFFRDVLCVTHWCCSQPYTPVPWLTVTRASKEESLGVDL